MSDESIADQAAVIAEVEILKTLESRWSEPPVTEYLGIVQRVLKGNLKTSTVTIQVPGGKTPDGLELHISSVPIFKAGEKALLFLVPNEDGTHGVLHWALGAFRIIERQDHLFAVRDLSEANVLSEPGQERLFFLRDSEKFADWLRDRADSKYRDADYFEPLSQTSYSAKYTLLKFRGKNLRWFNFDAGRPVDWRFRAAGSKGTLTAFKKALRAWNRENQTPINYRYRGTTGSRNGFNRPDGINAIIFGDPNRLMPGRFACGRRGVLAAGGPWFETNGTTRFGGRRYYRIREADIVVNDGAECYLGNDRRKRAGEVFAHELGHTLGINHSCGDSASGPCNTSRKDDALMRAYDHDDLRGASLRTDDKAALRRLYRGGGTNPPAPNDPSGLAAPTNLTARATSPTELELRWKNNSPSAKQFDIRIKQGSSAWQRLGLLDSKYTGAAVSRLTPGQTYRFMVIAKRNKEFSERSNIAKVRMPSN
ncbi:MAG: fibronectin type III domain-containing protein [Acidobacteria bacterium]|nr:fibronectin type III domain-containing protein [Acidobacteriota bacterium]